MVSILESVADFAPMTTDTRFHIEKARQALASQICHQYADDERILHVLTLDSSLEQKIFDSKATNSLGDIFAALEPSVQNAWMKSLWKSVHAVKDRGFYPVILTSPPVRYLVKTALDRELPEVAVLSIAEIVPEYKIEYVGVVVLGEEQ